MTMSTAEHPFLLIQRVIASQVFPEALATKLSCFVALGDSFTAGTGAPAGEAWPDRIAEGIRARNGGLAYRNLAVDGATSEAVLEQAAEAVELEPDLVTVVCGGNDVLGSTRPDIDAYAERMATILGRLGAGGGVRVVTATMPEAWEFLELRPRTQRRVEQSVRALNRVTRNVAGAAGVPCLDMAGHPGLSRAENFCEDGLHPSALGHERAARGFSELLRRHFQIETGIERGDVL